MMLARRSSRSVRATIAVVTAVVFLTPLSTPVLCARQHEAALEAASRTACHGGHDAPAQVADAAAGHAAVTVHAPGDACADMPWCGVVAMAPLRDLQHSIPVIPDHWEPGTLLAVTALQATIPADPPPPRA